jgi:hypothetical protein
VATVGPISVALDASHNSFKFYRGGEHVLCRNWGRKKVQRYNDVQAWREESLVHGLHEVLQPGYAITGPSQSWHDFGMSPDMHFRNFLNSSIIKCIPY